MPRGQNKPYLHWIIGSIVSIILAFISIFQNQYTNSIIIFIIGLSATYLFDLTAGLRNRDDSLLDQINSLEKKIIDLSDEQQTKILISVEEEGEKITQSMLLGEKLAKDEKLRQIISQIVDESALVKKLKIDVFTQRIENLLNNCRNEISNLADGEEEVRGTYSFIPTENLTSPSHMLIVLCHDPSFLKGPYGHSYLSKQQETIKRNRHITMIWVQPKEILVDDYYREFIAQQEKIQVEIFVAEQDEIPTRISQEYSKEEFGIVDERIYFSTVFDENKPDGYIVSTNQGRVNKAKVDIRYLLESYAQKASVYYKQQKEIIQR